MEKVVVVIQDKKGVGLERFIFSINQMVELEAYDRDQKSVSYFSRIPMFDSLYAE